ncbi:MAG: TonB-dependent receptor [Cyclobacteriaceae bacterium]|nr:TonB-dependent receptor [Cyclobacteriaceae bacterium]
MLKCMMMASLMAVSWSASAQAVIRGYVKDKQTAEPLTGATVMLKETEKFSIADENGYFSLNQLTEGSYELEVRFVGYRTQTLSVKTDQGSWASILLEEDVRITDQVIVSATRVNEKSPTSFTTINKTTLQKQNFGQDLPITLNWTPSVVTTSDAGAGVGYTGLRIRGSDATRINVTINGIPINDSESQGVFWVNTPDLASSTQSVQVQRGVGTSTNGAGAFGASVNLQTNTRNDVAYADVINSGGSFNTRRHTVAFGTGLINDKFVFDGRVSQINSDGFIDRASSDLKSYYLSGGYYGKKTMIKAIVFGGKEITYQSWYGVPESRLNNNEAAMLETATSEGWDQEQTNNLLSSGRTFNSYTYENQVDNYAQDHYQLHSSHRFSESLTANGALHFTYGRGFYEEYRMDDEFQNYGLADVVIGNETSSSSDLIRRRWLDNNFYGVTYSLNYERGELNSTLGGAWNQYDGAHFGQIIWAQVSAVPKGYQYYFNNGKKSDFTLYWKTNYQLASKLTGFIDLQYRGVSYQASGKENKQFDFGVDKQFNFFNPKVGVTYETLPEQQWYASYSVGNREPVRDDFIDALAGVSPKHETLHDIEAGWRFHKNNFNVTMNYYLMKYKNQLVPTGKLNDVGAAIRTNVNESYRSGIEVEGIIRLSSKLVWNANITFSQNKIKNFNEVIYDYGDNFDEYNEVVNVYSNSDISFSPNVIAGSGFMFTPIKNIELGLLTKYVGKQFLDNTSNDSRIIDSYFTNDLRLSYTVKPSFMREISLSLLANNIFDMKYSSNGYTYGYRGGAKEYRQNFYYPQAGRNYMLMLALRF